MSTNIPDGSVGPLTRAVSDIADSVAGASPDGAADPAGAAAGDLVKSLASDIEQLFQKCFGSFLNITFNYENPWMQRPMFARDNHPDDTKGVDVEISTLRRRIDSMRAEAERLLNSAKQSDQVAGRNELEAAMQLFSLLARLLGEQAQIQAQQVR